MNAILKKSSKMEYHTRLTPIFEAIHPRQLDYNWLLTLAGTQV